MVQPLYFPLVFGLLVSWLECRQVVDLIRQRLDPILLGRLVGPLEDPHQPRGGVRPHLGGPLAGGGLLALADAGVGPLEARGQDITNVGKVQ